MQVITDSSNKGLRIFKFENVRNFLCFQVSLSNSSFSQGGMVPRYTGHIPRQNFKYGATFGSSTHEALKQMQAAHPEVA